MTTRGRGSVAGVAGERGDVDAIAAGVAFGKSIAGVPIAWYVLRADERSTS
jgi:hypothetical protein